MLLYMLGEKENGLPAIESHFLNTWPAHGHKYDTATVLYIYTYIMFRVVTK